MKENILTRALYYGFVAMFCILATAKPVHAQKTGLGIAAVVNDDVISVLDLEGRVSLILNSSGMKPSPESRARIKPQILRSLIDEKLMMQESNRTGIKVLQSDISKRLTAIASQNKMDLVTFSSMLSRTGVPISTLTAQIEAGIAWQMFVGRKLSKTIIISEDEITDEIKRIQANAGKPEYLLAEIFLPVIKSAQDQEIRALSQRLLQEMKRGASFKDLATNFSRASSASEGGDMGWVQYSHLAAELKKTVQLLKPGQVSTPVRSLGGYYLILLRDVRNSPGLTSGKSFLKVSQLHVSVANMKDTATVKATAEKLTSISRHLTSCPQLESAGGQANYPFKTSPLTGSMGEINLSNLPPNMQKVLGPLAVGQPSLPMRTGGGLAVMMVCERTNEALNMDDARTKISDNLRITRINIAARRRLHNLRRNAFVDIRR